MGIGALLILLLIAFLIWRHKRNQRTGTPSEKLPVAAHGGSGRSSPSGFGAAGRSAGAHPFNAFAAGGGSPALTHHRHDSAGSPFNDESVVFDQRVDPNQFYMRWEQNGSKASLQDNDDYSRRVLRVANPDHE